jgi:predicted amidohydrolase YtcJ
MDMDIFVNRTLLRGDHQGEMFTPEESIDRVVALKLFTYRSAVFLYAESKVGSLEVGKFADFIVTDKPFLSGPDREIHDNKIALTVQADEIVYKDPDYNPVRR